jgi:hypothetical protein
VGVAALISDYSLRGPALDSEDQVQDALDGRFRRFEHGNLPAPRHDQHAIGMRDDFLKVRRDEDYAHPLVTEAPDGLEDLLLGAEVDTARRLVQEQDARLPVQPFADHQFLLIAAGQR